ncbi:hypothetical protein JG688_00005415 [Phytophthora aleatoria]|uniref:Uncharacterized protein n=1 Tax=Phytophthora aleatoria TaxID=2496075 RepID=A0A8J5J8H8_9STRA|nr:hypothetical protein JG688_00005415 [Phytophthora aleatoria]
MREAGTYSSHGSSVVEGPDPAAEFTWITTSSVLMSSPSKPTPTLLFGSQINKSQSRSGLKMFPALFPCQCGGTIEHRDRHISVRYWILRCLRIHGHRFEKHYAFMLLAFDFLACENARRTLYFRMNVKRQALKEAENRRSTVVEAIKYFKYVSLCLTKGLKPRHPVADVQHVIDLCNGL